MNWINAGPVRGPAGPAGPAGPQGPPGPPWQVWQAVPTAALGSFTAITTFPGTRVTVTLTQPSDITVWGNFDVSLTGTGTFIGACRHEGQPGSEDSDRQAITSITGRNSVSQVWRWTGLPAGSHDFMLRCQWTGTAGQCTAYAQHSQMLIMAGPAA